MISTHLYSAASALDALCSMKLLSQHHRALMTPRVAMIAFCIMQRQRLEHLTLWLQHLTSLWG